MNDNNDGNLEQSNQEKIKVWVVTTQSGMHCLMINLLDKNIKDLASNYSTVWHSFFHVGNLEYASQVSLKDVESLEPVSPTNIEYWQRIIDGESL